MSNAQVVWTPRLFGSTARRTRRRSTFFRTKRINRRIQGAVSGRDREAELWSADTGEIKPAAYSTSHDKTVVSLQLAEREAVFVVFRKKSSTPERTLPPSSSRTLATLVGPWEVTFPPGLGAPAKIEMSTLQSWTENAEAGVKYFRAGPFTAPD